MSQESIRCPHCGGIMYLLGGFDADIKSRRLLLAAVAVKCHECHRIIQTWDLAKDVRYDAQPNGPVIPYLSLDVA